MHRVGRILPLLTAALLPGLIATGSFAVANGQSRHQGRDQRHGANTRSSDQRSGDRRCGDAGYSAWDEQWLKMSIQGDRFEIQGGDLAQHKATKQIVRDLGARLVKDHTKSLQDAVDDARKLGIDVPQTPSPSQQWELRAAAQFKGAEFDKWYSDLEVQDHIQDIQDAQDEIDKGCNEQIKQLAKDDLPVLQQHLELARTAAAAAATGDQHNSND
jgi:putative membrane protein